jgi:hypothetical protein
LARDARARINDREVSGEAIALAGHASENLGGDDEEQLLSALDEPFDEVAVPKPVGEFFESFAALSEDFDLLVEACSDRLLLFGQISLSLSGEKSGPP